MMFTKFNKMNELFLCISNTGFYFAVNMKFVTFVDYQCLQMTYWLSNYGRRRLDLIATESIMSAVVLYSIIKIFVWNVTALMDI